MKLHEARRGDWIVYGGKVWTILDTETRPWGGRLTGPKWTTAYVSNGTDFTYGSETEMSNAVAGGTLIFRPVQTRTDDPVAELTERIARLQRAVTNDISAERFQALVSAVSRLHYTRKSVEQALPRETLASA